MLHTLHSISRCYTHYIALVDATPNGMASVDATAHYIALVYATPHYIALVAACYTHYIALVDPTHYCIALADATPNGIAVCAATPLHSISENPCKRLGDHQAPRRRSSFSARPGVDGFPPPPPFFIKYA